MSTIKGPFGGLYELLKSGQITRREFITRATALGIATPITMFVLNATKVQNVSAQDAPVGAPSAGTESQTRGAGGELKLLQWQAPTHMSSHIATGTKDQLAASIINEPLLSTLPDGTMVPCLAAEVPSIENGGVAEDLKSVTYKLKEGILWSDGTPLTSADVVATWQYIVNPDSATVTGAQYSVIADIETPDDLTVTIKFTDPQIAWFNVFVGSYGGAVYPKHILDGGKDAIAGFAMAPIGTGAYKVESFTPNDQAIYVMNENYREPNKPFFEKINLKGGGDATSAAQAVLQTGDWDFAWNLQVDPTVLKQMAEEGGKGTVVTASPSSPERVLINFSDPNTEVDGQRSEKNTPHPFFTDKAVRQALSLATDRETIANQFYLGGDLEPAAKNILTGIGMFESPNTTFEFNLDLANQVLDEAGWAKDGDYRAKDGVELKITYSTTINPVRQKTQAVNKQNWEKAGFKVQLKQVDSGIFFDSSANNEQNASHFYEDILMYTNGPVSAYPLNYMLGWYAGADGKNISQKSNGWSGGNNEARYNSPEYDALWDACSTETNMETAAELMIQMNDLLMTDVAVIPLVARASEKYAISTTLNDANVAGSLFEALYWNIANWNRVG